VDWIGNHRAKNVCFYLLLFCLSCLAMLSNVVDHNIAIKTVPVFKSTSTRCHSIRFRFGSIGWDWIGLDPRQIEIVDTISRNFFKAVGN